MRSSIVLLITLVLIVALAALIAIALDVVQNTSQTVEKKKALIQKTLLAQNIVKMLNKSSVKIETPTDLQQFLALPYYLKTDEIEITITFDSAAKGLNPNLLMQKRGNRDSVNTELLFLFDKILLYYNVANKELFLAMIEDTLDSDLNERMPGSELSLYDRRFAQGRIENKKKFQMLIDAYVKLTEDGNIKKVPWEKLVSFYNHAIDINYISAELLAVMLSYADEASLKNFLGSRGVYSSIDNLPLPKEERLKLKKYGVTTFVPIVQGHLCMKRPKHDECVRFVYNLAEKKVLDIALF